MNQKIQKIKIILGTILVGGSIATMVIPSILAADAIGKAKDTNKKIDDLSKAINHLFKVISQKQEIHKKANAYINKLKLDGALVFVDKQKQFQTFYVNSKHAQDKLTYLQWKDVKDQISNPWLKIQFITTEKEFKEWQETFKLQMVEFDRLTKILKIQSGTFSGQPFIENRLPQGMKHIKPGTFYGATFPLGFELPKDMKIIPDGAFEGTKFATDFKLPQGLEVIGENAFAGATLPKNFQIPTSVIKIKPGAFFTTTLPEGFEWPIGIKRILSGTFENAILPKDFQLPKTITYIGDNAFRRVKLPQDFKIPSSVTHIGVGAFEGATLPEGFEWPIGIKRILSGTFENAILPKDFKLPKTITYIGDNAFRRVNHGSKIHPLTWSELPTTNDKIHVGEDAFKRANINIV